MKNLIIFSLFAMIFLAACNEKDIIDNADQVGISKVTYYANLALKGNGYMAVAKGSAFTDPGVTATAAGATLPFTVSGTVNANTVGVYVLTYTAVNKDGFPASIQRWVAVYSTDATATANDFSGNYARTSNGVIATWTKLAPGVYKVFNPGGAAGTNITLIAFNPSGTTINVPSQTANDGSVFKCTDNAGAANINYITGPPASYAWKVINPGYGTSLRTFIKQ